MKIPRVVILTEGGKNIGFGHITRCKGLYQAFLESGAETEFIINGDTSIKCVLEGGIKYKISDWLKHRNKTYALCAKADIVVIDSYHAGLDFYARISADSAVPVYIDDYKRLAYPKGIILNGSIRAEYFNYRGLKGPALLGTRYIPLRKEFWRTGSKRIGKNIQSVIFTLSGMNFEPFASKFVAHLKRKYAFKIIDIYHLRIKYPALKMKELYMKADLCVSGGGQTTYELACCGTPSIGICLADNQIPNLKNWSASGFLLNAGSYDNPGFIAKFDKLISTMNLKKRIQMSKAGKSCVDGKGSLRTVKYIVNTLKNIRTESSQ